MATVIDLFGNDLIQYEKILRPFAVNLTNSTHESEDLIQDTLYRALKNKEKFSEGTNIKAWLFTIMKNIFINNYRRKQRHNTVLDGSEGQFLLNSGSTPDTNGSERSFLMQDITRALNEVSQDLTRPFMMYYSGYHYHEIAEQMHLPLGTVKSRIFFARKELQQQLKGMGITDSSSYN